VTDLSNAMVRVEGCSQYSMRVRATFTALSKVTSRSMMPVLILGARSETHLRPADRSKQAV